MKKIGLMAFNAPLHGEAKKTVGASTLQKTVGEIPTVTDGIVDGMAIELYGVVYVVNAFVLSALKGTRKDVVGFDPALTVRSVVDGKPFTSQGGFIK
jgi:hypothetical protein